MAFAGELVSFCKLKIDALNTQMNDPHEELRWILRDLTVFHPNGLQAFTKQSSWLVEFAKKIGELVQAGSGELVPYVTNYGAALGMLAVWNQILAVWIGTPWTQDNSVPQAQRDAGVQLVNEYIEKAVPSYTKMIVK